MAFWSPAPSHDLSYRIRFFKSHSAGERARKRRLTMAATAHLWAVGYDDMERASQVRDELAALAWDNGRAGKYLILDDIVVVVRNLDGSFTLNREPFQAAANILGCGAVGFLVGLVVAAPLAGALVGALVGTAGSTAAATIGIDDDFVREVEAHMKPGTSALFVLDDDGDMDMILRTIRGLGGSVLKTNVDLARAKLIQSTLSADATPQKPQATSSAR
jgi:uncharacterized membrane protein